MEVPHGYKQTSIGIIPEDWDVKRLNEIGFFFKGKGVPKDKISFEGLKCLTYGDLYTKYNYVIKNIKSFIDAETASVSQEIKYGDICFAGSGETLMDIGKCATYVEDEPGYAGGDIIILRSQQNPITLSYLLNSVSAIRQKYRLGQGHSIVHIYPKQLEKLKIPLPPLPEQQKIAEILSTWDTAIETCQKTIEQLKQRNKGLAQQLLSGKKRLAGFSDKEWSFVKFKEFYAPNKKPSGNAKFELLSVTKNGIVSQEKYFNKSIASEDTSKYLIVENGDFVVSGLNFWMGSYDVLTDFEIGMVSPAYKVFRLNEKYSKSFFKHLVASRQMKNAMISSSVVGASIVRRNFDLEVLYEYAFRIPDIGEQDAIGNVLDAAQSELRIYECKLQNLQQQKKGLMQQLLTGKVRVKV